jgi:hypothetical protein
MTDKRKSYPYWCGGREIAVPALVEWLLVIPA